MAELDQKLDQTLPLLPLTSGVVLPGMVVTMALETPEARAAGDAGASAGRHVLRVPRVDGRYAKVGTISRIEEAGQLPSGVPALVVRGVERATIGAGVPGTGHALWVQVEGAPEGRPSEVAVGVAREYRAVLENILEARHAGRMI